MEKKLCFANSLTFQLEMTGRIFYGMAKDSFQKYTRNKVTLEEFVVLESLVCYPHLNAGMLAKTLMREKAYVENILSKLIKKKLICEVKTKNNDIKVQYYKLTDLGTRLYNDNCPESDKMIEVLATFISEKELVSFTKTLLKIRNIIISLGYST